MQRVRKVLKILDSSYAKDAFNDNYYGILASFEKETAQSLRFSDVDEHGRIVNVRLYARVLKEREKAR